MEWFLNTAYLSFHSPQFFDYCCLRDKMGMDNNKNIFNFPTIRQSMFSIIIRMHYLKYLFHPYLIHIFLLRFALCLLIGLLIIRYINYDLLKSLSFKFF